MSNAIGRLNKGEGLKGPEPLGCFNTGVAPMLWRANTGDYLVGADNDVYEIRQRLCFDRHRAELAHKRIIDMPKPNKRKVYKFKGRNPAIAKFTELYNAAISDRNADIATVQQARKDANSSDPEKRIKGALTLGDYGVA